VEKNHNVIPEDLAKYKVVTVGDLVINKMKAWQGSLGVADSKGVVSPAYFVYRPHGIQSPYLHALLRSRPYIHLLAAVSEGVRVDQWDLSPFGLKAIPALVPPPAEQLGIVRFLEGVHSAVELFITKKNRLIELLDEEKRVVADRAIAQKPDVDGTPPEGWRAMRLKYLAQIGSRLVDPRQPEFSGRILIAPNHVESGSGRLLAEETASVQGAESGKYLVREGELIYGKIRPALRKVVISPVDGLCSADMYPISVRSSLIDPEFLQQAMLSASFTQYAVEQSMRVAMPKVNREALGNAWVSFPDLAEQRRIVDTVKRHAAGPDRLIGAARKQVKLLTEYRARLVADVVTGKLDVREVARSLPQDPDRAHTLAEHMEEAAA
jgi:type I restriction enzyme S subunit